MDVNKVLKDDFTLSNDNVYDYSLQLEIRDGVGNLLGEVTDWVDLDFNWSSESDDADTSSFSITGSSIWYRPLMRANVELFLVRLKVFRGDTLVKRWTGRIDRVKRSAEGPQKKVDVELLSDKIWLKYILAWPSPFNFLNVQFPKNDIRFGPAIQVMKEYAVRNLVRLEWNARNLIDNHKRARGFLNDKFLQLDALRGGMHPVFVAPTKRDTSPPVSLVAQMTPLDELYSEVCKDYNILPEVYLWVPGDDPDLWFGNPTRPTVIIDFIDKDRGRATGFDQKNFGREIAHEIGTFIRGLFGRYDVPPTLRPNLDIDEFKKFFGTDDEAKWVIFRDSDEHWSNVEMSVFAPRSTNSITGGKSNQYLNTGIALVVRTLIQEAVRALGIGLSAVSNWITGELSDILFAFQQAKDDKLREALGPFSLFEDYNGKGSTAYSRDAAQAIRVQRYEALGYKTAQFTGNVSSFAPFRVFEDFDILDPVGFEDAESDMIIPERIKKINMKADRSSGVQFEIRLGESERPEEPFAIQQRRNQMFQRSLIALFNAED